MSSNVPINQSNKTAPTPVNTPHTTGVLTAALSRPTVPDIQEDDDDAPLPPPSNILAGLMQNKLSALIGKSSGYIENLPKSTRRNVEALKGVQTKWDDLHKEFKKEMLELENKYLKLAQPIFERRTEIISGKSEPTDEEVALGEEVSKKDDPEYVPLEKDEAPSSSEQKGVPDFWLTALRNHVGLSELITDRDECALAHLTDITITQLTQPKPGFKLTFHFSKNDYFENDILEKTYLYQDELGYSGDYIYDRAEGCEIKWKEDKDLTKSYEIKKQRNKNTNRTRLIRKAHPVDSFFNFFSPPAPPAEDAVENGDIEEEQLEEIEDKLELDYQIGEDLKERIIPRAVDFFTGKALEYEDIDDLSEDEEFDEDDDDDEEEEESDDDDASEDDAPPARRRGPPAGRGRGAGRGGASAGNADPQECKQQ